MSHSIMSVSHIYIYLFKFKAKTGKSVSNSTVGEHSTKDLVLLLLKKVQTGENSVGWNIWNDRNIGV